MDNILEKEEKFHDEWANSENIDNILVDEYFESCTTPENKYILEKLGNIQGKKLLEIGCGLGEASVYFAKKGADVTASDLSGGMLKVALELAKKHNVTIKTLKSPSDKIEVEDEYFDIVYAGNLLHHVNIDTTLKEVRTEDEHPLKMRELKLFKKYFSDVEYDTFWLFTNFIFVKYYFIDKVNPNKERYWKKIIKDAKNIEKLYSKLENLDKIAKKLFPFLKRYCWNISIICHK